MYSLLGLTRRTLAGIPGEVHQAMRKEWTCLPGAALSGSLAQLGN